MKILVLSDTHMPEKAKTLPEKILLELKKADLVVHAGDFVDLEVLDVIKKYCVNVKAVCGNMDSEQIRAKLPQKEIFSIGKFKIAVMHGYGPPNKLIEILLEAFKKDKPDLIIFGHSHFAWNQKQEDILFFNPGSPTDNIFAPYKSFGIIDIDEEINARIVKL